MRKGISAVLVMCNEEKVIGRCLESLKDVVDEIIAVHDGPCIDDTLKICKKYTKKIFIRPKKGMCEYHQNFLYNQAKYDWILKIDPDEFLSENLRKNLRKLIEIKKISAISFLSPIWDGEKYATKRWPRKILLYKKSDISFIGFPNWAEPKINGNVLDTNFHLEHRPLSRFVLDWKTFKDYTLKGKIVKNQARATLKNFNDFEKFQYHLDDFPLQIRIRKKFPLISAPFFSVLAPLLNLYNHKIWKREMRKDSRNIVKDALFGFPYYLYLGYYIHQLKKGYKI
tara:strand:- start:73 stop:921 length:849 start_codon:yes stop_codon:yes gene_type:complete